MCLSFILRESDFLLVRLEFIQFRTRFTKLLRALCKRFIGPLQPICMCEDKRNKTLEHTKYDMHRIVDTLPNNIATEISAYSCNVCKHLEHSLIKLCPRFFKETLSATTFHTKEHSKKSDADPAYTNTDEWSYHESILPKHDVLLQ